MKQTSKEVSLKINLSPFILLSLFLFFFCGILAAGWLSQNPTHEELYGSGGRFIHEFKATLFSPGGFSWWSTNFMQGHSTSNLALSALPISIGIIFVHLFGDPAGIKLAALAVIPLAAFAMFLFVRKLIKNEWTALIAALLYILSASMLTRIANFEHWIGSYAYIFPPLIFWSFLKILEEGSLRSSVLLAFSWAGMMLSYTKLALMFLPLAAIFFFWLFQTQSNHRFFLIRGTAIALGCVFFLAGILFFPLLREYSFVAGFHFDPFLDWQHAFCLKNMISVLDRNNQLLVGMPPLFFTDRGQFYIGLVILGAIAFSYWKLGRTSALFQTKEGVLFRLFLGISLTALWLSYGPYSPLTGLLDFLRAASNITSWVIPFVWLLTLLPLLLLDIIIPRGHRHLLWFVVSALIYFFIPGFLILEKLPLFHDIRAPWGFWEIGCFAATIVGAIALQWIFSFINNTSYRIAYVLILGLITLLDSSSYIGKFFTPGLPEKTFSDFHAAEMFLKSSSIEGRVYPLSARYFYLRTPMESGKGLTSEASWNHFQMKGARALLQAANSSTQAFQTYACIAGVSHLLVDKEDPFTSPDLQNTMAQLYPLAFDSEMIRVLENKNSLAPAFLARDYITVEPDSYEITSALLEAVARFNVVPLEIPQHLHYPYLAGVAARKTGVQISQQYTSQRGKVFQRIPFAAPRLNASTMSFLPPSPTQGWLVVTEAWHPDWKATAQEKSIPIYKAFTGLMAIPLDGIEGTVTFKFTPPFWYNLCLIIVVLSWLVLLGLLIYLALPIAPLRWKEFWTSSKIELPKIKITRAS